MSANVFSEGNSGVFLVESSVYLSYHYSSSQNDIRPAISLKSTVKIADGGDGTAEAPYEFVLE